MRYRVGSRPTNNAKASVGWQLAHHAFFSRKADRLPTTTPKALFFIVQAA
ncbi:MAG: hypothetical protein IJ187_00200 [Neisseriaceae bacterium]|nr:hypothetical protein [Neisseriaceae bacterium]